MRRVVVTGLGAITPLGLDVGAFWGALLEGRSGVSKIEDFSTDKLRSDVAASVRGFDPLSHMTPKEAGIYGRVTQFCIAAADEAMKMAGLAARRRAGRGADEAPAAPAPEDAHLGGLAAEKLGCLMSTGQGAVEIFEEQILKAAERGPRAVSPFFIPGVMLNAPAAAIAMRYGLMGPSYGLVSACATGTHSIATGALMIEAGDADLVVCGGSEAATRQNTVAGFGNARALAKAVDGDPTRASRPFAKSRAGFVMGEGAGVLVLEEEGHARRRGAEILARLAGFGMTTDATNLTAPHPEGLGLALAMGRALERAGVGPEDVGFVNPHATSTPQGDRAEYLALRRVFGERLARLPVCATKSMIGHLLGGAGAVEAIATVCSLKRGVLHPSLHADELDPEFDLDLVREKRSTDARFALKASAGFGGHNCALLFERVSERIPERTP